MRRKNVYQLKILLAGIDPPVWRRVQVRENTSLPALHNVFQCLFNWEDYHLHSFTFRKVNYEPPDPEDHHFGRRPRDETRVALNKVVKGVGTEFLYKYDFGDGWKHIVLVEGILMPEEGATYPRCIAGARNGPPEDSGGPSGYADYLDAPQRHRVEHPRDPHLLTVSSFLSELPVRAPALPERARGSSRGPMPGDRR